MLTYILLATLTCGITWLYLRWSGVRSYWAKKGVPHEPPHPFWGSLAYLQYKNTSIYMREMYKKFSAPYIGMWLFWRPALIVNCPEIGKRILVKDFDVFRDRFLGSGKKDPMGALNIFTVNDPLWTSLRKRLTPVFTSSKLRSLHGLMLNKSKQLTERIQRETKAGKNPELRMLYADYTTDIIGIASFGVDSDATVTGESHMRTVTLDFMKYNLWRGMSWISIFFLPELVDIFGFTMFPKKATDYLKKVFTAIANQRSVEGSDKKDLMDALLKIKADAEKTNEEISTDTIIAQAAIFLQGGFDTSANALTLITYELAHDQTVQERLYNEIVELKKRLDGKDFHGDDLVNLVYMTCVINEVLRKYPPMGFLDRIAARDYKIDDKLTIPAGTPVYVNAVGMHLDPKYFPNPEKFDPDRFLPENEKNMHPNTFLPFGDGPRICIGQRFSSINIRYAIACVLLNYKVRPLAGSVLPNDWPLEKYSIFAIPEGNMNVEFIPRNEQLVF